MVRRVNGIAVIQGAATRRVEMRRKSPAQL